MKNYFIAFSLLAFSLLGSNTVLAAVTGAKVLTQCQQGIKLSENEKHNPFQAGVCAGMIDMSFGFNDILVGVGGAPFFCVPSGATIDQAARIIVKYLENNPEKLHTNGHTSVITALMLAFPCNKDN